VSWLVIGVAVLTAVAMAFKLAYDTSRRSDELRRVIDQHAHQSNAEFERIKHDLQQRFDERYEESQRRVSEIRYPQSWGPHSIPEETKKEEPAERSRRMIRMEDDDATDTGSDSSRD